MQEYGFSQTRILPHKHRNVDHVLIKENTGQWKPVKILLTGKIHRRILEVGISEKYLGPCKTFTIELLRN